MATKKSASKPVSSKQAAAVANFLKSKTGAKAPVKAAPMDAEDKLDGGVDENEE